jgi:hypothetical protein
MGVRALLRPVFAPEHTKAVQNMLLIDGTKHAGKRNLGIQNIASCSWHYRLHDHPPFALARMCPLSDNLVDCIPVEIGSPHRRNHMFDHYKSFQQL